MSQVIISGDTSGTITLQAPAVSGFSVLTLPATTATLATLTTPSFASTIGVGGTTAANSGAGISFPATQSASSDANTLDDYEEGTWTGTLIGGTTAPTTPVTATGKYTKVGNQVTIWIRFANKDTTGASGEMRVTGIPFSQSGEGQTGAVQQYNLPVPNLYNIVAGSDASTTLYFYSMTNNGAWANVNISAGTTRYLNFTLTYFV